MRAARITVRVRTTSPLAALIARSAHLIKPPMGSRQGFCLRQRSALGQLVGSHRHRSPETRHLVGRTGHQQKETASAQANPFAQRLRSPSTDAGSRTSGKTRKRRAMGQTISPETCTRNGSAKGMPSFCWKEINGRPFPNANSLFPSFVLE
jgi:hypothetical protein